MNIPKSIIKIIVPSNNNTSIYKCFKLYNQFKTRDDFFVCNPIKFGIYFNGNIYRLLIRYYSLSESILDIYHEDKNYFKKRSNLTRYEDRYLMILKDINIFLNLEEYKYEYQNISYLSNSIEEIYLKLYECFLIYQNKKQMSENIILLNQKSFTKICSNTLCTLFGNRQLIFSDYIEIVNSSKN